VIETCRQQGQNVLSYITEVLTAHFARKPAPSILNGV